MKKIRHLHLPRLCLVVVLAVFLLSVFRNGMGNFMYPAPDGSIRPSIRLETSRDETAKLTSYRVEIPFRTIGMTRETAKNGFRFNLIVNDNDGDLREGFLAVAPGLGIGDEDPAWPIVNLE